MKYSIMTEPQMGNTYDQILRTARLAEVEGLYSFARSDHLAWSKDRSVAATDALTTVAGLARDTDNVRLCVLVTPITFRHPAIIAKTAATLDEMSGGRFDLGLGTGWNEYEHDALGIPFPDSTERWERLEDALGYVRAAFAEGSHDGPYYSLDLDVLPKPTGIRLIVGGSGKRRTPTLAARLADEYNLFICSADEARAKIEVMRDAAGDRQVETTMMGSITIAGSDAELGERLLEAAARRDISREELISRWEQAGVLFGTSGQVKEKISALEEVGVERIYLQWLDLSDYDGLAKTLELVRG